MAQAPTPRFSNEQKQPVVIQNKMPKAEPGDMTGQFGGGSGTGNTFRLVGNTSGNQTGSAQTASSNPYPTGYTSGIPSGLDTVSGPGASYRPAAGSSTTPTGITNAGNTSTTPGLVSDTTPWQYIGPGGGQWAGQSQGGQPVYTASDSTYNVGGAQQNSMMANSTAGSSSYGTPNGGYYNLGASAVPYVQSRPPQFDPSSWSMFLGTPAGQQYMANNAPGAGGGAQGPGTTGSPGPGIPNPMLNNTRIFNTGGGASPGGGSNHPPQSPTTGGGGAGGWLTVGNPSGMTQQNRPGPGAPPPRDGVPGPRYGTSPDWPNRGWRSGVSGYQGPGPNVSPGSTPPPGGENAMYGRGMAPSSPGGGPGYLGPPVQEGTRSRPNGGTQLNPTMAAGYQPLSTANFWWLTPNPNDGPSNYEDPRYTGPRVPWNPSFTPGSRAGERLGPPGSGFVPPPGLPVDPGPGGNQDPRDRMMSPSLPPFPQFDPASPPDPRQLASIMQDWYRQFVAATGGGGQGAPVSPQNPIQNPTWGAPWPGWQGDELRNRPPYTPPTTGSPRFTFGGMPTYDELRNRPPYQGPTR